MYLPESGFYSEFKWVEVAEFMANLDPPRVIRHQKRKYENGEIIERTPILYPYPAKEFFKDKDIGLYTSIWRRKTNYIPDTPHPILAPLYFDLDSEDINLVFEEVVRLWNYLLAIVPSDAISIYFTGKKGFHIEVNPIVFNAAPSATLPEVYKFIGDHIAKELSLTTMDTAVRDSRRMWRLPNSRHQSTGLFKVQIPYNMTLNDILQYAKIPQELFEPAVEFNMEAAQWFRGFQYQYEDEQQDTLEDRIKRFEKFGTGRSIVLENEKKVFNPLALYEGTCKFVKNCMEKAEANHDLSHSERLALCSLLSYTDEALEYLFYILSQCSDFNESKSQFHVQDWIHRREKGIGGRPMSCKWLRDNGLGCGNCDKLEKKYKMININGVLHETSEAAEQSPYRLLYKQDNGTITNNRRKK